MYELLSKDWSTLSKQERRGKIVEFEEACRSTPTEQHTTIEPTHFHCNGVYAREIRIPAGTALVGEIHKTDQINIVSAGTIRVATEEGVRDISAPYTFISPAGTKRAGYALTDTVWTVLHATSSTDEAEIKRQFIAPTYEEFDKLENKECPG